ncbi:MAG: SAM hydrolase/SAM-dependent halogenase family protein [Longimicrobiales bacterium]
MTSASPPHGPDSPRRITLLTDFGTADGYGAAMRGVIASRCAGAMVEDASHDIAPGDVRAAAHALSRYWFLYPAGTVHVVVVDPGVGSGRRGIAVLADGRIGVGPDNGVFEPMLNVANANVHDITNAAVLPLDRSNTFHGRDVFAPAAAFLSCGGEVDSLGPRLAEPVRLAASRPETEGDRTIGRIVHIDRFGNLITDIPGELAGPNTEIWLADRRIGAVRRTYSDVTRGEFLAVIGSTGLVEISVRDGNAAGALGVNRGAPVIVRPI